ncbi:MAG: SIR2 family protein [Candidatus Odinarchaeota archaeon]
MSIAEDTLYDILDLINANRMVLFLGAGSTRPCRRPDGSPGLSGQELADEILKILNGGKDPGFQVPLTKAAEFYVTSTPAARASLDDLIRRRLAGLQPTLGHLLVTLFPWKAIITTNYNVVIEEAYRIAIRDGFSLKKLRSVFRDDDLISIPKESSDLLLYKPHGCISAEDDGTNRLIVTSKDYFDSAGLRPRMYETLNSLVKDSSTLFIGYSMDDYTFKNIYYDLQDQLGLWQMRLYNVSRKQHDLLFKWTEKSLDKDFNTTLVRTTFEAFMVQLLLYQGKSLHPVLKEKILEKWPEVMRRNKSYLDEKALESMKTL